MHVFQILSACVVVTTILSLYNVKNEKHVACKTCYEKLFFYQCSKYFHMQYKVMALFLDKRALENYPSTRKSVGRWWKNLNMISILKKNSSAVNGCDICD